jgi:hypothetical protein
MLPPFSEVKHNVTKGADTRLCTPGESSLDHFSVIWRHKPTTLKMEALRSPKTLTTQVFTVSQPTIPQSKQSPRGKHENLYSYSSSSQIKGWRLFQVLEILRSSYQSAFQLSSAASSPRSLTTGP